MRDEKGMQIQSDETAVTLLAGVLQPERIPYPVFSPETMEFLAAVSAEITRHTGNCRLRFLVPQGAS